MCCFSPRGLRCVDAHSGLSSSSSIAQPVVEPAIKQESDEEQRASETKKGGERTIMDLLPEDQQDPMLKDDYTNLPRLRYVFLAFILDTLS